MKLASIPEDVRQAELNNLDADITNSITALTQLTVAAGSRTGETQFPAPASAGRFECHCVYG